MRSRLLVSAAILVAGLAAASAQNAPGGVGHEHHNGLTNGRLDGHNQLRNQNRRAMAARKAEPLLRTRANEFGFENSSTGPGLESPHRNPHAMAKRHGDAPPGQMSQRSGARGDLLPPAKPSDASVVSPRGQWGRGDRDRGGGMASDRSIWDRAMAQGRVRSAQDRIGQGDRNGRNRGLTRLQPERAFALPKERGQQDLARNKAQHRLPDRGMGRADARELRGVRSQARSVASHSDKHRGSASNVRQDEIRKVQTALNKHGFNVGDPDGRLGRQTKEALIAFQKQRGFRTTGKVDRDTRHALLAGGAAPAGGQDKPGSSQPRPVQAAPQGVGPGTTGQGSAAPQPAAASPQPIEGETPPTTEHLQMPDSGASGRVPAGSPQEDYKDDTPAGDQR
jgi:hypothetical protein